MTSHSGAGGPLPAAQVETFSSANAVVVGVLRDLLAVGSRRAASAWVHAHTAFVEGERSDPLSSRTLDEDVGACWRH